MDRNPNKPDTSNNPGNGPARHVADNPDESMLPQATRQDINALAAPDPDEHKNRWQIFSALPKDHKWPYFYRHFFWPIVIAALVGAAIVAFVVNAVTTLKGQGLGIAYIQMNQSAEQMDKLKDGFTASVKVDPKLVTVEDGFYPDSSNTLSAGNAHANLETQISGGTLNALIGPRKVIEQQDAAGFTEPLDKVINESEMKTLRGRGAVIDMPDGDGGRQVPMALDLSKSRVWTDIDSGAGKDSTLAFVNVSDLLYVHDFVRYLYDL